MAALYPRTRTSRGRGATARAAGIAKNARRIGKGITADDFVGESLGVASYS